MRFSRIIFPVLAVAVLSSLVLVGTVRAQEGEASMPAGVKGDMMIWFGDAEEKLLDLADAMPQDKYAWRPGEGVRSQGEVFLHVAAANYGLPSFWGVNPPEGFEFVGFEQSATKKDEIKQILKDSFDHMTKGFMSQTEENMNKEVTLFGGNTMTIRAAYMLILSHDHEHLGQSIAYARTNGIVPPWTARQQEQFKEGEEGEGQ